jgi:hypothetical protein
MNEHHERPKRDDDLAGANSSLPYKPTQHFIKLKLRTWIDPLELSEQQNMDEIRTVECEEPV